METKLKNFIMLPRSIKDDYLNGKITKNEYDVLIWLWLNANPVNGYATISYDGLTQDLRGSISYGNARKIISSLRAKHYIYFLNHRGRQGSFSVYPIGFYLRSNIIQTEDHVKNKLSITTRPQTQKITNAEPQNNSNTPNHNLEEQKMELMKHFSMDSCDKQITTPYNDTETKTYIETINDIKNFNPKNHEEMICKDIAIQLREKSMAFILSCRKKYGFNTVEQAWGIYKESKRENIKNPGAYFNKIIQELTKNNY